MLLALLGNRRALRPHAHASSTASTATTARWLRRSARSRRNGGAAPPQGRFNAGQKLNAALIGGLMVAMA